MDALLLENTEKFKKGDLLKEIEVLADGIKKDDNLISHKDVILLNEALTSADETKIKNMIKEFLKQVFWRLYSRNSFVLQ